MQDLRVPEPQIFLGREPDPKRIENLPPPPPWRQFTAEARKDRGKKYLPSDREIEMVNAALYLRRPLLVTGKPGTGKSSLPYAVAEELGLGVVLDWSITTRTSLNDGLYHYDAIGRLQDASMRRSEGKLDDSSLQAPDIGRYIRLGPLGTAFLPQDPPRPRVLLIDEIDKSDIDFPNDLLHVFEKGEFEIPELSRLPDDDAFRIIKVFSDGGGDRVEIEHGKVRTNAFPFVVMTSNGERDFPPAFLRRCLRLDIQQPTPEKLADIVRQRLCPDEAEFPDQVQALIDKFVDLRDARGRDLATDQLLNAVYMLLHGVDPLQRENLHDILLKSLTEDQ